MALHTGQHPGGSDYYQGQIGGYERVPLDISQIPAHGHDTSVNAKAAAGTVASPDGAYWAQGTRTIFSSSHDCEMAADAVVVDPAGDGTAHENRPPFQVIRFCVSLSGVYPQRP